MAAEAIDEQGMPDATFHFQTKNLATRSFESEKILQTASKSHLISYHDDAAAFKVVSLTILHHFSSFLPAFKALKADVVAFSWFGSDRKLGSYI